MSEWIEYDGSDNQIEEIKSASYGVMFGYVGGDTDTSIFRYTKDKYHIDNRLDNKAIARYLICQPHPYADLIDIWRLSGCPAWVKHRVISIIPDPMTGYFRSELRVDKTTKPDWNTPGAEYRLTPFED